MVEALIIKWIFLKENMVTENKQDRTVGACVFMEWRRKQSLQRRVSHTVTIYVPVTVLDAQGRGTRQTAQN